MRNLVLVFMAALVLPCPAKANEGDINVGKQFAEANCAKCHAIGKTGESERPEAPKFRELSKFYPIAALEEAFAEGIVTGHPDMPEFEMDPEQINDLLEYIRSVQIIDLE